MSCAAHMQSMLPGWCVISGVMMKICVYGAGAIGGLFAARLAAQGHDISIVARGRSLAVLQQKGVGLVEKGQTRFYPVNASAVPADLGAQDLVVVAVKQPDLHQVAKSITPLLHSNTRVLLAMNGVPWWFFDGLPGHMQGATLSSVDLGGDMRSLIPTQQVIGCVVHISCIAVEPGVSQHRHGDTLIVGEPLHSQGPKQKVLQDTLSALSAAGFDVQYSECIQRDIWFKLWGNMTMNPVSAITGATTDLILDDAQVRAFCSAIMDEASAVGAAIGCQVHQTAEQRHAVTRELGAMRTSMLQDVQAGRALEIDALLTVVCEIAQRCHIQTPHMNALLGLVRLFAQTRGLYPRP